MRLLGQLMFFERSLGFRIGLNPQLLTYFSPNKLLSLFTLKQQFACTSIYEESKSA